MIRGKLAGAVGAALASIVLLGVVAAPSQAACVGCESENGELTITARGVPANVTVTRPLGALGALGGGTLVVKDTAAPISSVQAGCLAAGSSTVLCAPLSRPFCARVTGDRSTTLDLDLGACTIVSTGAADDRVRLRPGTTGTVHCGGGTDVVTAPRGTEVGADCESVTLV